MAPPVRYKPAPGPDDFRVLREGGYHYVDKTGFIVEWLARPDQVVLLPRPRRFGKSLNLSTLRYFLDKGAEDLSGLFDGLAVRAVPAAWSEMGRYPVIFLSLKDTRARSWSGCLEAIRAQLARAAATHPALQDSPRLSAADQGLWRRLTAREATPAECEGALLALSGWLHAHHDAPVVLLIDEYDAPIEAGYEHGWYDEVIAFMRNLLGGVLKSNPHLFRGVLTGVRRISKESLFSGVNNVRVHSLLDPPFSSAFGFTEAEVAEVLAAAGRQEAVDAVRDWYNGYDFGGQVIYNPWSVLSFAQDGVIKEYWASTSSEELLRQLIPSNRAGLRGPFERLLQGDAVEAELDEHVVLRDLEQNPAAIWSFLLTAGYLKASEVRWVEGRARAKVSIPNREVLGVWRRQFSQWLTLGLGGSAPDVEALIAALMAGDARLVQRLLRVLVQNTLSVHDTGAGPGDPERVYQAFVLGLLVWLEPRWRVRSNRESGYGRADVLILPTERGRPGVVLEIKRLWSDEGETPEAALADAQAQIRDRGYAAEVEAAGASVVRQFAVVFSGKSVWVA
ncbi:MAG: AAA family ATPase [Alphaproteobacteria bacterium]|nr:AAA family ATPase [Alphaproteobacteria bacterium]